jgi:sugar (pentulose or hexulose) kinase
MPGKVIVGIDGGTQSTKVLVVALDGTVVAEATQPLRPVDRPRPGIVEHPGDDLWDSIAAASRAALARFPGDPSDIVGVGLCTIRCCKAFLRADGSLAAPVMSWMDTRAYEPYVPDVADVAYATTSSGYITHRLTGRLVDTAANTILLQWPIDTDTWQWSEDDGLVRRYGLRREMLPELALPGDVAGHVTPEAAAATGLPAGVPVVHTANDKAVEALGSGVLDGGTALLSLGTYITAMVPGRENRTAPNAFWTNFACVPGTYLYESHGIRRGMWTVTWFLDLLGPELAVAAQAAGMSREDYLEREAALVPPGSDGLVTVLDWLAPTEAPFRKGIMLGFDARHTRGHVYRSILEAIALTMRANVDAMCAELGIALDGVVVSGGGAGSALALRIVADAFGAPASRAVGGGSGAGLGAAICAAVATGSHPDVETAVARMTRPRESFTPDSDTTRLYERMRDAVVSDLRRATDPVLERAFPIFH